MPDIKWVKTTNFCDIAAHSNGRQIAVFSAIDNLVKGAARQAVQNMNLMFGLDETRRFDIFDVGNLKKINPYFAALPKTEINK